MSAFDNNSSDVYLPLVDPQTVFDHISNHKRFSIPWIAPLTVLDTRLIFYWENLAVELTTRP